MRCGLLITYMHYTHTYIASRIKQQIRLIQKMAFVLFLKGIVGQVLNSDWGTDSQIFEPQNLSTSRLTNINIFRFRCVRQFA